MASEYKSLPFVDPQNAVYIRHLEAEIERLSKLVGEGGGSSAPGLSSEQVSQMIQDKVTEAINQAKTDTLQEVDNRIATNKTQTLSEVDGKISENKVTTLSEVDTKIATSKQEILTEVEQKYQTKS